MLELCNPCRCVIQYAYPKPWLLSRALLGIHEENHPVYCSWLEQVIWSGLTAPASKPSGLWYGHSVGKQQMLKCINSVFQQTPALTWRSPAYVDFKVTNTKTGKYGNHVIFGKPLIRRCLILHLSILPPLSILILPYRSSHPPAPKAPAVSSPSVTHIPS